MSSGEKYIFECENKPPEVVSKLEDERHSTATTRASLEISATTEFKYGCALHRKPTSYAYTASSATNIAIITSLHQYDNNYYRNALESQCFLDRMIMIMAVTVKRA